MLNVAVKGQWGVCAVMDGDSGALHTVTARTALGAKLVVLGKAAEQGIPAELVEFGLVMRMPEETPEQQAAVERRLAQSTFVQHCKADEEEMAARVEKGVTLLNRLANDLLNARCQGVEVEMLVEGVDAAIEAMQNAVDAQRRRR